MNIYPGECKCYSDADLIKDIAENNRKTLWYRGESLSCGLPGIELCKKCGLNFYGVIKRINKILDEEFIYKKGKWVRKNRRTNATR